MNTILILIKDQEINVILSLIIKIRTEMNITTETEDSNTFIKIIIIRDNIEIIVLKIEDDYIYQEKHIKRGIETRIDIKNRMLGNLNL